MTAILPVAQAPQHPVAERTVVARDAVRDNAKKFDDVMRQESQEQSQGPEEVTARESTTETEEGSAVEERAAEDQSDASPDGESQEQAGATADAEAADSEAVNGLGLPGPTAVQQPVLNLGATAAQPALQTLPKAGLLALAKEVKPLTPSPQVIAPSVAAPASLVIDELAAPTAAPLAQVQAVEEVLELPVASPVAGAKASGSGLEGASKQTVSKVLDVAVGKIALPNFQATVVHETIQPVDPTQSADRARMVEAILRVGGGELQQLAGKVLQLRLNPPELGRIQIRAQQRGGELIMQLEVERADAVRVFQDILPGLEFSLAQASGENVTLELRQTDDFSSMEEGVSEGPMEESRDDSTPSDDGDEGEEDSPFEVLRDGSTVEVTA